MYKAPSLPTGSISMDMLDDYSSHLPGTMVLVLDDQGMITECNSLFLSETGYTSSTILNRSISSLSDSQLFNTETGGDVLSIGNRNIIKPAPTRLKKANGEVLILHVMPLRMENGHDLHHLLLLFSQEPVKEGNLIQRFGETMLRDDHIGVILLHPSESIILDISPLACRLLGASKSAIVNEPLHHFFASSKEYKFIQSALAGGPAVRNYPMTWIQGSEQTELLMDVGLFHSSGGVVEGAYILFKDVTNLRSLEVQVQRSDRLAMIGQIAAGAAHEIRNPLTAIRGFMQMFQKTMTARGMTKEVEYTEIMLTELDRINSLVGEFLMLSKPRHVTQDLIQIDAVFREIMPMVASEALLHSVSVSWEWGAELPVVKADPEMLKQVLLNICKNGIEAMSIGGTLTVHAQVENNSEGRWLMIEIQDTGPGIPLSMLDKIFDPFVTTKANGTGLGLSVCQRILHDFGGSIRADTTEEGALFTIMLPC
ncbi:ATP-binding protein [Paenibacillus sepulcri]|uniref:histidine kinase n=1 Tax=Paenibacillus sepulcri TaxID=359917 RepID=A0ABS7C314_9BACL|nr:PAS domain-containing protein [Paenibacillus sepulcri]